jgi:hypothetical protein
VVHERTAAQRRMLDKRFFPCERALTHFPEGGNRVKITGTLLAALLLVSLLVLPVLGGAPLDGTYTSTDIGGPLNLGRYTESWLVPGGALNLGTVLNSESWDGANLGLQWRYWCASIELPPLLLVDNVDANGNGSRTYQKTFLGGFIWLSGTGPWANGDPEYPGVIDSYVEFETIQYLNWQKIHAVTNIQATAHFDNYPSTCLTFSVGNGLEIGSTDTGATKPSDYPGFLEKLTCDPTRVLGGWWDFFTVSLVITGCGVPAEPTTWGAVKSQYTK